MKIFNRRLLLLCKSIIFYGHPWVGEVNEMLGNTNNKSENQESDVNKGQFTHLS